MPISKNTDGFIVGFVNSYRDNTIAAGVHYAPLKVDISKLQAKLGVTAAITHTENGSYAKQAPELSIGNITALAGLYTSIQHIPSGFGVETIIVPPVGGEQPVGFAGVSMKQRF